MSDSFWASQPVSVSHMMVWSPKDYSSKKNDITVDKMDNCPGASDLKGARNCVAVGVWSFDFRLFSNWFEIIHMHAGSRGAEGASAPPKTIN